MHDANHHHAPRRVAALALASLLILPLAALAAGGAPTSSSTTADPKSMARDSYNRALKYRDKAWEYEAKAAAAEGSEREKYENKVAKEFRKAEAALREAIRNDPMLYQAHSSLGYVLRKTGDFDVLVHLHADVEIMVKVHVLPED